MKAGDKVVLNAKGIRRYAFYPKITETNVYAVVERFNNFDGKLAHLEWFALPRKKIKNHNCRAVWISHLKLFKTPKDFHNHPLTSIFMNKMPKTLRASKAKPKKKRLTKKKSVVK